ncbi:hypothetical protein AgCh_002603 [Apium graveolens]
MYQSKPDLKNIEAEGSAMLDEYQYVDNYKYQQPKSHVYQIIIPVAVQAKKEVVSIDSYQAAQRYGGILIAEHRKNKKPLVRLPMFHK